MSVCSDIPIGASSSRNLTVAFDMTVAKYHPEMPEVLGTPIMIYLMEVAAADAIEKHLPEGWVSVGALVNVKHLAETITPEYLYGEGISRRPGEREASCGNACRSPCNSYRRGDSGR